MSGAPYERTSLLADYSLMRLTVVEERTSIPIGDAAKMAAIMIVSADQHPAPKRIALGSDAYNVMHKQLSDRLAALEAQKELAFSTDFGPGM